MTDLHTPTADDPSGSEDGPAPDDAIIVSHPGGDGGGQGVGTGQDPGGDGGSEQSPMPDDPQGALSMDVSDPGSSGDGGSEQMPHEDPPLAPIIMEGNPGGDGMTEESPPEDPPPSGALHEITMG